MTNRVCSTQLVQSLVNVVIPILVLPTITAQVGGGPGDGKGGKPDEPGVNCSPLGNALIIQEPGEKCPDDNVDGGLMMFDFEPMADSVKSIGLLDIDYLTLVKVEFMNESGKIDYIIISVPLLGDNSYQLVSLDVEKVTGPVRKESDGYHDKVWCCNFHELLCEAGLASK